MLADRGVRTFADLRIEDRGTDAAPRETRGRDYRFVAMASDISHGRLVRLPWDYQERFHVDPAETPVAEAVRASMSIPYYFVPAQLTDHVDGGTTWMVDGGMLSNFPVGVFDREDGAEPRWPTFGIKLSGRRGLTGSTTSAGSMSTRPGTSRSTSGRSGRPNLLPRPREVRLRRLSPSLLDVLAHESEDPADQGNPADQQPGEGEGTGDGCGPDQEGLDLGRQGHRTQREGAAEEHGTLQHERPVGAPARRRSDER